MEALYVHAIAGQPIWTLLTAIAFLIFVLGTGADMMVDAAVELSRRWGVPQSVVGATIVSLGTTFPECAVSVAAAIQGEPDIALGNAVGSIICDTGLILGLANCMAPLPLDRQVVGRQGWIQLGAGVLLVVSCFPFAAPAAAFVQGGRLPRPMGWVFLLLLAFYIVFSVRWSRMADPAGQTAEPPPAARTGRTLLPLAGGAAMVVVASRLLIPLVGETALRLSVPESIVGATLVAFGTSLPELATSLVAAMKKEMDISVGNLVGSNVFNIISVLGAASLVRPLQIEGGFFQGGLVVDYLVMMGISVLPWFMMRKTACLTRANGAVLLMCYGTYIGYLVWKG